MTKMYDYRVCQVQQQYVTFVNGEWQGYVPLSEAAGAPCAWWGSGRTPA